MDDDRDIAGRAVADGQFAGCDITDFCTSQAKCGRITSTAKINSGSKCLNQHVAGRGSVHRACQIHAVGREGD